MNQTIYRIRFEPFLKTNDIEATLLLSLAAAESLYGESHVRLEACHAFDSQQRLCVIDAGTLLGRDILRLFIGFLSKQFGPGAFTFERLDSLTSVNTEAQLATG